MTPNRRHKGPSPTEKKLEARRQGYEKLSTEEKRGSTRPGSGNPRK